MDYDAAIVTGLPIKLLPIVQRWDCQGCGNCCRGSTIPLDADDRQRLQEQGWRQHPDFRVTPIVVRQGWLHPTYRLAQRPDGACVFLTDEGRCRIHEEHGAQAKPLVCQMYPLQLVPIGETAYLTTRRSCPAAARDEGRPLDAHRKSPAVRVQQQKLTATAPPYIVARDRRSWHDTRRVLKAIELTLTAPQFPLVRRLVHAARLADLLEHANLRSLDSAQLAELLDVLESSVADDGAEPFRKREVPSRSASVLLRQTALEYLRLHPSYRAEATWQGRWRLLAAAVAMARGRGKVPNLLGGSQTVSFAALEQPLGRLDAEVYQVLDRYYETQAASAQYAAAGQRRATIIDRLRALVLAHPVAMWMLRLISAGRTVQVDDAVGVVNALERGQGFAPLTGWRQQQRVAALCRIGQMERLIAWYAQ